jgi:hypothetical protein
MSHRCDENWKGWSAMNDSTSECSVNSRTKMYVMITIVPLCTAVALFNFHPYDHKAH